MLTATDRNNDATHVAKLKLKTTSNTKINLPALYNLSIRHSLLSLHDIAQRVGPILITEKNAILLEQDTCLRILGIPPCTHEGHILNIKSTLPTSAIQPYPTNAYGVRAIPTQQIRKKNPTFHLPCSRNNNSPISSQSTPTNTTKQTFGALRRIFRAWLEKKSVSDTENGIA